MPEMTFISTRAMRREPADSPNAAFFRVSASVAAIIVLIGQL
jgi:hypothetical protein